MFKRIFILASWLLIASSDPIGEIIYDEQPITCQAAVTYGYDIAFERIGTFRGNTNEGKEFQKTYFFPKYFRNGMAEAKAICKSYNLELVTFETITEALMVMNMCENNQFIQSVTTPSRFWVYVDGMTTSAPSSTEWFWTNNGKKVGFVIPWAPNQPDFYNSDEFCLAIGKDLTTPSYRFGDYPCVERASPFLCSRLDYML